MTKQPWLSLEERIADCVRRWPQWSRAERRKLDEVTEEILDHVRNGAGNSFVRQWCARNLSPLFPPAAPPADRHCEVIDASIGHTRQADDDGAYDLHDVRGTVDEVGKAITEAIRAADLLRGGKWSYLENGQPIYLALTVRIVAVTGTGALLDL